VAVSSLRSRPLPVSPFLPYTTLFRSDSGYGWGPRIQFGGHDRPDNNHALIRVQEQGGIIPNLVYRAPLGFGAGGNYWSRPSGTRSEEHTSELPVTVASRMPSSA